MFVANDCRELGGFGLIAERGGGPGCFFFLTFSLKVVIALPSSRLRLANTFASRLLIGD